MSGKNTARNSMPKIAIIHTTPVTVDVLKPLVNELLPEYNIVNFVDDSILPQLAENGGEVSEVEDRLLHYARFAEGVGADVILSACSSVGEVAAKMRDQVGIPVIRIDDAMTETAIQRGSRIGVAATLPTTLRPTLDLLRQKADTAGKLVQLEACLVDAAYQKLMAGDREGHDATLAAALTELAERVDVVVLAQASMARVLPRLPENIQVKFLTSPRLSVERVKSVMETQ
jgi:Asp/Glu/hydantoin racemase